jgi:flagellar basal-body rod protein FlgB
MFFNSYDFKLLEAGTNLAWTKQEIHMQNIANVETPGYKAKQLDFVNVLDRERTNVTASNIIETQVVDDPTASVRPDGNNVNMEKESIELYKSYAQYSMLLTKVKSEFDKYGYVLNSSMK